MKMQELKWAGAIHVHYDRWMAKNTKPFQILSTRKEEAIEHILILKRKIEATLTANKAYEWLEVSKQKDPALFDSAKTWSSLLHKASVDVP